MHSPNPTGDLFADLAAAGPALAGAPALQPGLRPAPPRLVSTDPATLAAPAAARELWLCLWLPRLPLEALATDPARPAAAVTGAGTRRRLLACNAAAARAGVTPGQGLNAALALVPELALHERSPALEAALLGRLARWGTQFTPLASLEPPDALLLEVRGSRRLFGGAEPLRRRAAAGLAAQGYTVVAALAPTPRAALWLARAGLELALEAPAALPALASRLPLACLCWPVAAIEALTRFGVATVADLVRLPRDGLARRLGPELLAELDEAFGRRPSPRRRAVVPLRFTQALELPAELESTAQLMPAVSLLVRQLVEFLRSRGAGVPGLVLEFRHRSLPPTRLRLGLARPSADERHLCTLLGERLARLTLPAPVRALRLRTGPVMPLEGATASLLAAQEGKQAVRDPAAAARLVERLRARLGSAAVFGVQPVPEHRPESAWRVAEPAIAPPRQPAARRGGHSATTASGPAATGADRPLWMLASPLPLAERDGRPCYEGELKLMGGPERIESGWWDGRDVRRDYYVAEARCGARLWIYRERGATGGWFLHGVFG